MAMVKNTMPSPPNQCIRLRQNKMEWGRESMSLRAVAPVVVKPDILSKNATEKSPVYPPTIKGRAPMAEKVSQERVTQR